MQLRDTNPTQHHLASFATDLELSKLANLSNLINWGLTLEEMQKFNSQLCGSTQLNFANILQKILAVAIHKDSTDQIQKTINYFEAEDLHNT